VGGPGSSPEATKDPVVMAAQVVLALQTIISHEKSVFLRRRSISKKSDAPPRRRKGAIDRDLPLTASRQEKHSGRNWQETRLESAVPGKYPLAQ